MQCSCFGPVLLSSAMPLVDGGVDLEAFSPCLFKQLAAVSWSAAACVEEKMVEVRG